MPIEWGNFQSLFQLGAAANLGITAIIYISGNRFSREHHIVDSYRSNFSYFCNIIKIDGIDDQKLSEISNKIDKKFQEFDGSVTKYSHNLGKYERYIQIAIFSMSVISFIMLCISTWPIENGLRTNFYLVFCFAIFLGIAPFLLVFATPFIAPLISGEVGKIRLEISSLCRSMQDRFDEIRPGG